MSAAVASRRRALELVAADRRRPTAAGLQPLQLVEHLVQAQPLDELHDVVGRPVVLAHAEDRHDVGVVQLRRRPRLALESVPLLGVAEDLRRQELQRHVAAEGDLLGLVDDAHPAAADLAEDPVVAQLRPAARGLGFGASPVGSPASDSSARAIFSIMAIAGKTSRISSASEGWRSMYSFSEGRWPWRYRSRNSSASSSTTPESRSRSGHGTLHPAAATPSGVHGERLSAGRQAQNASNPGICERISRNLLIARR